MALRSVDQIGTVIQNGVALDLKNWHSRAMNTDDLIRSVRDLFSALEARSIEYVLVGGIALLYYVDGRNTQDLDLLMAWPSLAALPELEIVSRDEDFIRATIGSLQVDILLTRNPVFRHVFHHYSQRQSFLNQDVSIASVEGLLLLKLYALPPLYQQGDFARVGLYENDIATLTHAYGIDGTSLLPELVDHLSDNDMAELRNILADIKKRIERFKGRGNDA